MADNSEKKIFLVDPDPAVRDSIRAMLESYGVSVRIYSSGRSFLNNAQINGGGCVLLENNLPDMTGIDLIEKVKQKGINIPFIILSSANDAGFDELITSQDIAIVIRKPLHSKRLLEIINNL